MADLPAGEQEARLRSAEAQNLTYTEREIGLLRSAADVLGEKGYDRFTVDEVAQRASASKATLYRRWPSKADLAVSAVIESLRSEVRIPDTGSLRDDLLILARQMLRSLDEVAATLVGILTASRQEPALRELLQGEFNGRRREIFCTVLARAVDRGDVSPAALEDDLWDLLPGYLLFRSIVPGRQLTDASLIELVDRVMIPALSSL
jgi:AcrR family transcriptional regulator